MGQKKRIGIIIAAVIVVLLAAGVIGFFLWQQSPSSAPVSEDQTSSAASSLDRQRWFRNRETGTSSPAEPEAVVSEPVQTPPTVEEIQLTTYQVSLTVGQRQMPIVTHASGPGPGQRGNLDFFRPVGGYSVGSGLHLWGGGGKLHRDGDQFRQSRSQRPGGGDSQPGACFGSTGGRNPCILRNIFRQRAGLLHPISLRGLLLPSK